jgi:hypothetical protein
VHDKDHVVVDGSVDVCQGFCPGHGVGDEVDESRGSALG